MINSKFIINESFIAIAITDGNIATDETNGEFVFSKDANLSEACLKEIANANKIKIPNKLRKSEQIEFLLNNLKIKDSLMSKLEKVIEIVNDGVENGKTDDEIKIEIIQSGFTFKEAGVLFKKAMEQSGHRISATDRIKKVKQILDDKEFNPSTYEEVQEMAKFISEEINDTTESKAISIIKTWAKNNEIQLPMPKRKTAGRAPGGSIVQKTLDWLVENIDSTEQDIVDYIISQKDDLKEAQMKKYVSQVMQALNFARKLSN